jgi:hypothetical protein
MIAASVGGVLMGLSLYLYLAWQSGAQPAFNYAGQYDALGVFHPINLRTPSGLWWLMSGQAFSDQMFGYHGGELWREAQTYLIYLWRAFFAVGIGPGWVGIVMLVRREPRLGGALLLMFGASAAFYIDYRVIDKDTMFLPTYLVWALWLGIGYQWLLDWVREFDPARRWASVLVQGVLIGAVVLAVGWNWRLVDLSDDRSARQLGEQILNQAEPNALILGWWDTVPVVQYLQLVEGQRPDVQTINRFLIPHAAFTALILREARLRPVYVDNPSADILTTLRVEPAGVLYRLRPLVEQ